MPESTKVIPPVDGLRLTSENGSAGVPPELASIENRTAQQEGLPRAGRSSGGSEVPSIPDSPGPADHLFSPFGNINQFREAQRMGMLLSSCSIVPEHFRGGAHLGDCVMVLEMANRLRTSVLGIMQNLRLVYGKPGWSSQFLISCVNASRRFTPLRFEMTGVRGSDSWGCIAWAKDEFGLMLKSPEVTIGMAKREGWFWRPGSKWRTMPELMLCYRSATLFARLYAPDLTMGLQTAEEVADIGPESGTHYQGPSFSSAADQMTGSSECNGSPHTETTATTEVLRHSATVPAQAAPEQPGDHYDHLKIIRGLMALCQYSEAELLSFLQNTGKCVGSLASLAEIAEKQPNVLEWAHDNWAAVELELRKKGETRHE